MSKSKPSLDDEAGSRDVISPVPNNRAETSASGSMIALGFSSVPRPGLADSRSSECLPVRAPVFQPMSSSSDHDCGRSVGGGAGE